MASSTSQTQESARESRRSQISGHSRRSNGRVSTINSIDNNNNDDNNTDLSLQANPRKRSRPQSEDTDSESSNQPSQTKKPKSSPPDTISIQSSHKIDKHPFLLNISTLTSAPNSNPSHHSALFLGTPPELECSICYDTFSPSSPQYLSRHAQCTPIYHTTCLERWVAEGNPTCPHCRGELLSIPTLPTFEAESEGEGEGEDAESEQENRILRIVLGHIVVGSVPLVWQWSAIDRLVAAGLVGSPQVSGGWGREGGAEQQEDEAGEEEEEEAEWEEADGEEQQQDAEEEQEVVDGEQLPQQGDHPPQSPTTRAAAALRRRFHDYEE